MIVRRKKWPAAKRLGASSKITKSDGIVSTRNTPPPPSLSGERRPLRARTLDSYVEIIYYVNVIYDSLWEKILASDISLLPNRHFRENAPKIAP